MKNLKTLPILLRSYIFFFVVAIAALSRYLKLEFLGSPYESEVWIGHQGSPPSTAYQIVHLLLSPVFLIFCTSIAFITTQLITWVSRLFFKSRFANTLLLAILWTIVLTIIVELHLYYVETFWLQKFGLPDAHDLPATEFLIPIFFLLVSMIFISTFYSMLQRRYSKPEA